MLELCSDLFWNLFWYSARFNLPLPLLSRTTTTTTSASEAGAAASAPHMLLLAGWDAGVVERGAQAAVAALHAFQGQRMAEGCVARSYRCILIILCFLLTASTHMYTHSPHTGSVSNSRLRLPWRPRQA